MPHIRILPHAELCPMGDEIEAAPGTSIRASVRAAQPRATAQPTIALVSAAVTSHVVRDPGSSSKSTRASSSTATSLFMQAIIAEACAT